LRRRPAYDLLRAQEVGLSEATDPEVPAWAAREHRVAITHDVQTMIGFAIERITRSEPMDGLLVVHQASMVPERLLTICCCSTIAAKPASGRIRFSTYRYGRGLILALFD
jgi:hypothetical protein